MASWAEIDATAVGEVTSATRVAGLPLVARQLRQAARLGWSGAIVRVSDAGRGELERAITSAPPPSGFVVEVVGDEVVTGERALISLDGRAVYALAALRDAMPGVAPAPAARAHTLAEARVADRMLYRSVRKPIEEDGVVAFFVQRPISALITRALIDTKVSANQVTLFVIVLGLVHGAIAASGGARAAAIAGLIFWFTVVLDCVDGELARLRLQSSRLGQWLDTIADDVTTYGLLVGLGLGLQRDGAGEVWLLIGVGGAAASLALKAFLYWDLHRMRLPIDTAEYPWFFGKTSGSAGRTSLLGRAFYYVEFLLRRDGYATAVTLLLLFGARKVATLGLVAGSLLLLPTLLVHFAVAAWRRRGQAARAGGARSP